MNEKNEQIMNAEAVEQTRIFKELLETPEFKKERDIIGKNYKRYIDAMARACRNASKTTGKTSGQEFYDGVVEQKEIINKAFKYYKRVTDATEALRPRIIKRYEEKTGKPFVAEYFE